jgi:hypothetical protein
LCVAAGLFGVEAVFRFGVSTGVAISFSTDFRLGIFLIGYQSRKTFLLQHVPALFPPGFDDARRANFLILNWFLPPAEAAD